MAAARLVAQWCLRAPDSSPHCTAAVSPPSALQREVVPRFSRRRYNSTLLKGGLVPSCTAAHLSSCHLLGPGQWALCREATGQGSTRARGVQCSVDWIPELLLGVGVGLPCTVMDCGDVIYRSTLPRPSPFNLTPGGVALAISIITYLWATPGVAPGFWDMFVLSPLEQFLRPKLSKSDLAVGRKLGEGAYGQVFRASLLKGVKGQEAGKELVVKKASQYGAAEVWMNERVRRACQSACAEYVFGFSEEGSRNRPEAYWLVWKFEGEATLADLLQARDFPYNVEEAMFGGPLALPRGPEREACIMQGIMAQIFGALKALHSIGIVHRDIKPQNIVFARDTGLFKIIDLGAAADLRVGINYTPKEFLLDPRYAAPEQYIMSTQTPRAPPAPLAAALSPVLWQMNLPDRFDVYSAGLIMLQLAFPNLRNDSGLIQFNRQLKRVGYDMGAWREVVLRRPTREIEAGFALLDADGGLGWDLVCSLVRYKARQRISAAVALRHPWFPQRGAISMAAPGLQQLQLAMMRWQRTDRAENVQWALDLMAKSGTKKVGGFTEAQLADLQEKQLRQKGTLGRKAAASALKIKRKVKQTVSELVEDIDDPKLASKATWWDRLSLLDRVKR